MQLTEYQKDCSNKMLSFKHCIVQMGTGTGKTYTALTSARGNTTIICTNKVSKKQWIESIKTISNGLKYNVYTYHEVVNDNIDKSFHPHTLIFDEAHNITGNSKRTRKIKSVAHAQWFNPTYIYALSATPVRNEEKDYYTIQKTLNMDTPLMNHFPTLTSFQEWCYNWGNQWNHFRNKLEYMPTVFNEDCRAELVRQSNIVFYEFKDRFKVHTSLVPLNKPTMDIYTKAHKHGVLDGYYRTFGGGSKVTVLHQLANSTFKFDENDMRIMDNDYTIKIGVILSLLNKHDKLVVVYNFNAEKAIIMRYNAYFDVYTDVSKFKDAKTGILLRQASRSSSQDIPYANAMVWYSMNYNGVDFAQMHGRISRLNSKYDQLYYYYLIYTNTIEQGIYDVATGKMTKNNLEKLYE